MKGRNLVMGLLLLPVLAHAESRSEFLNVQPSQLKTILDVKVDCRGRSEISPDMNIEILSNVKNKTEIYKAEILATAKYPETEVTVSRDGNEVCRYLTRSNLSAFNGSISLKIIDKLSLNGKFCEGKVGDNFEFKPSSTDPYLKYYANLRDLTSRCAYTGKVGDATREYLNRPLLKAGAVPEEITFLGMLKGIFN